MCLPQRSQQPVLNGFTSDDSDGVFSMDVPLIDPIVTGGGALRRVLRSCSALIQHQRSTGVLSLPCSGTCSCLSRGVLTQGVICRGFCFLCFLFFYEATHGSKRVPSRSARLSIVQHGLKGDLPSAQHVTRVGVAFFFGACGWSRTDGSRVQCAPKDGGRVRAGWLLPTVAPEL